MVRTKPRYNFLQGGIILELEPIPKRPLGFAILVLGSRNGLRETKEWKREVNESIFVVLELVLPIDNLDISEIGHDCDNVK